MKAASEPFTRSYLSPTMFTCLFLSRCIDWHQVCPALISSFSRRNQTAFPLTLLFVIDQHSFNARAAPYSILIRSIPPLLQQQFTPWVQSLSSISLIHCKSPSPASTSLPIIVQLLSPCPFSLFSSTQFHQSTITSVRNPHTRNQSAVCISLDF